MWHHTTIGCSCTLPLRSRGLVLKTSSCDRSTETQKPPLRLTDVHFIWVDGRSVIGEREVFVPLTCHWQWRSFGTWTWGRGRSRCPSGRGTTLSAGCGQSWPAGWGLSLGWPLGPGGFDLTTCHCPHQSCREKEEEGKRVLKYEQFYFSLGL